MTRVACAVVVLMLVSAAGAIADPCHIDATGGTIEVLTDESTVRMADEVVKVVISRERCDVEALFTFVNEGPEQDVTMGFPEMGNHGLPGSPPEAEWYQEFGDGWGHGVPVSGLQFQVDDELVSVTVRYREAAPPPESRDFDWVARCLRWHVGTMHMAPGQTRTVRITYWQKHGVTANNGPEWFHYALFTGKSWKGTIGDIRVEIEATDSVQVGGEGWQDGKRTWHFTDWDGEPDAIHVSYRVPKGE
jgi:hypothetical protein